MPFGKKKQPETPETNENEENALSKMPDLMLAKQQLDELALERNTYEEMAKRASHEADTIRKRSDRDKERSIQLANKELLKEFIEFLDDFERALKVDVTEKEHVFYQGVAMIHRKLTAFLARYGLQEIDCLYRRFNPHEHEAVAFEEDDRYTFDTVIAVLQKGYRLRDEIVRTPKVKVGRKNAHH